MAPPPSGPPHGRRCRQRAGSARAAARPPPFSLGAPCQPPDQRWAASAGVRGKEQSPKRGHARRAANVVSASSRDHANQRAPGTRDRSATSTRGPAEATIGSAVVAEIPGPSTGFGDLGAGASGHSRQARLQSCLQERPSPLGPPPRLVDMLGHSLSRSLPLSRGGSSVGS
jgi:hypothetical protein